MEQAQIVESLTCKAWAEMAYDVGLLQVHVQCCVHAAGVACGEALIPGQTEDFLKIGLVSFRLVWQTTVRLALHISRSRTGNEQPSATLTVQVWRSVRLGLTITVWHLGHA